jgi:hypothetical protein
MLVIFNAAEESNKRRWRWRIDENDGELKWGGERVAANIFPSSRRSFETLWKMEQILFYLNFPYFISKIFSHTQSSLYTHFSLSIKKLDIKNCFCILEWQIFAHCVGRERAALHLMKIASWKIPSRLSSAADNAVMSNNLTRHAVCALSNVIYNEVGIEKCN